MNSGAGDQILRSTSHKDRHTKVFTPKGSRHRRVRLSALTAIRFYDLQDRLGYDRPSKAVDWLINNAKFAIQKLQNPDRKIGETEHSVFNYQLKLHSAAGNIESFRQSTVKASGCGCSSRCYGKNQRRRSTARLISRRDSVRRRRLEVGKRRRFLVCP